MRIVILFLAILMISFSTSSAQLMDYVYEVKGDTLVVNDYYDMSNAPNSINNVVLEDSEAPAGRVYELKALGWYPQNGGFTTPSDRPVVIYGATKERMVQGTTAPPIISGFSDEGGSSSGGITWGNDLTLKNTSVVVGAPDGTIGWAFFGTGAANQTIVFENCMMETNWWVFVQSNANEGNSFYFKDNYFVNMSGRACRRNGGVYDNVDNNTDTMYVENNTHVMAQGYIYKFRNYDVNFIYINHNTFINCSNVVLETQGLQSNNIITNNIFINSNVQPFRPGFKEDMPEQAIDNIAQGIIDVAPLHDSLSHVPRKWLVQGNLAYWDSRVSDLATEANSIPVNGLTTWENQSMVMNDRTKGLFDDDATYPHMNTDTWYDVLPTFADPQDLLTDQVDILKTFSLATIDCTSTATMPHWRVVATPVETYFVYSDWPIPVDLSYSETDLTGTDGLPIGDLNWFPAHKETFMANHANFYGALLTAWNNGNLVGEKTVSNGSFEESEVGVVTEVAGWTIGIGGSANPVYEIVGEGAQHGNNCMKITVDDIGTNAWDVELAGDKIGVVPGETYVYSVWLRSDPTGGAADATVGNYAYNEYGRQSVNLTDQWQEVRYEFTITDQETEIRAPLHFGKSANTGKDVYVDNLTITPKALAIEDVNDLATKFHLSQNYPNPFNPTTNISYTLPKAGNVTLKVYNALGQEVATLVNGHQRAQNYKVTFDASNLASGLYIYTLQTANFSQSKKMLLLK